MATRVRADRLPFETGVVSEQIFPASQLLTKLTGEPVQANKAIVGRNAFAHEAGIHQDGMLKDRRTYEIMRPEDVGVPSTTLVLGKHSGRHAVQHRVQQLGLELSRLELNRPTGGWWPWRISRKPSRMPISPDRLRPPADPRRARHQRIGSSAGAPNRGSRIRARRLTGLIGLSDRVSIARSSTSIRSDPIKPIS